MSSTGGSTTWTVQSGASTVDYAVQDLDFYANRITIDAGDNVRWRTASAEPHTVTFLAPGQSLPPLNSPQAQSPSGSTYYEGKTFTNSGIMFGGHKYTLKFLKPGTYVYYCLLHQPEMTGTVVVQKAGTPYPHTQGYYLHAGADDEWLDMVPDGRRATIDRLLSVSRARDDLGRRNSAGPCQRATRRFNGHALSRRKGPQRPAAFGRCDDPRRHHADMGESFQ